MTEKSLNLENFVPDPNSNRTQKNIKKCLTEGLNLKYNISKEDDKIVDGLLSIHGLDKNRFDVLKNVEQFVSAKHVNDLSIDENSNKNEMTMHGLMQESLLPIQKAIGYDILYQTMKQLYGKKEAKRLSSEMFDYSLMIHDSGKILTNYCYSFDTTKLVLCGRDFGTLRSAPCKRIDSYLSALADTIHEISVELAGAVAVPGIFMDMAHILIYLEKKDFNYMFDKEGRYRITNEFQRFIYGVNHLSRNGLESPFSNTSVFDKVKLKMIVEEYAWYFTLPENISSEKYTNIEDWLKYVVDYIYELQNIYLDLFDKGDPLSDGMQYRFPITTANYHKDENNEIMDKDFLENITSRNFFRYNNFISSGNKVASCCRLINDNDLMSFGSSVNSFGGSSFALGSGRVVTINYNRIALEAKTQEDYLMILNSRLNDTAKILKAHKKLVKELSNKGLLKFVKHGWINLNRMFSTFGVIGECEAVETLQRKGFDITLTEILTFTNEKVKELSKQYEIVGNIEIIPGESGANRLCVADKLIFGESNVPYNLYSNQFVPLWEDVDIFTRLEEDGKYNKLITGGGIVHATIGENITQNQAKIIIEHAIKSGCEHFALNPVYSQCESNHYTLGKFTKCPKCLSSIKDYFSRAVGFYVPISSMSLTRRIHDFPNRTLLDVQSIK